MKLKLNGHKGKKELNQDLFVSEEKMVRSSMVPANRFKQSFPLKTSKAIRVLPPIIERKYKQSKVALLTPRGK